MGRESARREAADREETPTVAPQAAADEKAHAMVATSGDFQKPLLEWLSGWPMDGRRLGRILDAREQSVVSVGACANAEAPRVVPEAGRDGEVSFSQRTTETGAFGFFRFAIAAPATGVSLQSSLVRKRALALGRTELAARLIGGQTSA